MMIMELLMLMAPLVGWGGGGGGSSIHTGLISQSVELEGSEAKCHGGDRLAWRLTPAHPSTLVGHLVFRLVAFWTLTVINCHTHTHVWTHTHMHTHAHTHTHTHINLWMWVCVQLTSPVYWWATPTTSAPGTRNSVWRRGTQDDATFLHPTSPLLRRTPSVH